MTDKQTIEQTPAAEAQVEETNPYGNLEAAEPSPDAPQEFYCEISDEQIMRMQDEIDSIIDGQSEEAQEIDLDPSSNLLPASIRRALRRRMPREAIQRFANMTPVIDADGNQALVKERAVRIHAVVVDYLADKIFGERLSFEIIGQGITKAKDDNIIVDPLHTAAKAVFQVIAWAKVRCSVLRNDGSSWIKEDFASMAAEVEGKGANTAKAHRIAEMGAVTAARRRALQQYGRVFGGFDIRDMENTIGSIKEKQKLQEAARAQLDANAASQEQSFGQDGRSGGKPGKPKAALTVDPALKAQTGGATNGVTPSQPGARLAKAETSKIEPAKSGSGKPKVQPQVAPKQAKAGATQFAYRATEGAEVASMTDGEMFAKAVIKLINKAKTEDDADRAITLNRDSIALLEKDARWGQTVQAIMTAHEVKKALFASRAKKAQEAADRKAANQRKKDQKAEIEAAAESVDAAVADAKVEPAAQSDARAATLAETPDYAGFGGPSKPAETDEQSEAVEVQAWSPVLLTLEVDENGKAKNIHGYGQSVLEAVRSAPTIADLDRFLEEIKDDLAKLNKEAVSFINSTADQRRKAMAPK